MERSKVNKKVTIEEEANDIINQAKEEENNPTEKAPEPIVEKPKPVIEEDTRVRWQKIGGGTLKWDNHFIKPGEIFLARKEDLPKSFMDTLICLEKDKEDRIDRNVKQQRNTVKRLYEVVKQEDGWYLMQANGKTLNVEPLSEQDAKDLKKTLEE